MKTLQAISLGAFVGVTAAVACGHDEKTDHCFNSDGDAYCREKYGDERAFCSPGRCSETSDGCEMARPADDSCYSPCGGRLTLDEDPECQGVAEGSATSTGTTATSGPTTTASSEPTAGSHSGSATDTSASETSAGGCMDSSGCPDPMLPVCENMACVACGDAATPDAACEAKDAALSVCGDDGSCVQCTPTNAAACDGTTPVCDGGTSACVGCTYHEQCEATACDIATGACFDDACVVEVDGDTGPIETIAEAIGDGCVIRVHQAAGGYPEELVIDGGMQVAIVGAETNPFPLVTGAGGSSNPALTVSGGAVVYVQDMQFSGNDAGGTGITVDGGAVYLDRASLVTNTGGGLALSNGAEGHVRNSFVGGVFDVFATSVDAATLDVSYSSLVGSGGASPSLICTGAVTVNLRNSILVSRADAPDDMQCDDATVTYSATENAVAGTGNVAVGDVTMMQSTAWFADYNNGDFHLTPGGGNTGESTFSGIAEWKTGDPATDIDGVARPSVDGTPDVAGADLP